MSKYAEQSVVLEDRNSSTAMIVGLVPMSARVLDVGCSTGYLGEALKRERLARVWGIELDESLHSVWIDPSGGVWAVGGQVLVPPFVDGVVVHQGTHVPEVTGVP